jgi:hypothetical protein
MRAILLIAFLVCFALSESCDCSQPAYETTFQSTSYCAHQCCIQYARLNNQTLEQCENILDPKFFDVTSTEISSNDGQSEPFRAQEKNGIDFDKVINTFKKGTLLLKKVWDFVKG